MRWHRACQAGLHLAWVVGLLLGHASALAQEWAPSKTVRIVVPIAGTTNDTLARLVAPKLAEALGQAVIVENRPGAGGNIGSAFVSKADPDGHTLLVGYNGPIAINPTLMKNALDPVKDLTPVTLAMKGAQYLVVNPAAGVSNVQELVQSAKKNPNKWSYASVAVGSGSHLTMEMLKMAADGRRGRASGLFCARQCAAIRQGRTLAVAGIHRAQTLCQHTRCADHDRAGFQRL